MGVIRQVVGRLLADGTSAFRRLSATGTAAAGPVMSARSPRNVIVAKMTRAPFTADGESLPIGREYRSVVTLRLCSGVTLRELIERELEGS